MEKFTVDGGKKIYGEVKVSGAKNVAMKIILVGLLTEKKVHVKNVPMISSVFNIIEMVRELGVKVTVKDGNELIIHGDNIKNYQIPLEFAGLNRAAPMVMGPLLSRFGKAVVPNPGGCRIGKRPIDRHIEGLKSMGAKIEYRDGYFWAVAERLHGTSYTFSSNSHTGTENLILAGVLANGETVINNAAQEPEIDDLIRLLNLMGARIRRTDGRKIVVSGVDKLSGAEYEIMPDRNEVVTFAIAALVTGGDVVVEGTQRQYLSSFLEKLDEIKAGWEPITKNKTRFFAGERLQAAQVTTSPYPGFMTDWQAPWTVLMTQADGTSVVHETIYEDRFGYVRELAKMGAKIEFFHPAVEHPEKIYNFNWSDKDKELFQAIKIFGSTPLHNAILEVTDLRAGATLFLGALCATGKSVITGIEHIDRGYECIEKKFLRLGAKIKREKE